MTADPDVPHVRDYGWSRESSMNHLQEVTGTFREGTQAMMAVAAAKRHGLQTLDSAALPQDTDGVHVTVQTTADVEDVRRLLLEYGAYRVAISEPRTD